MTGSFWPAALYTTIWLAVGAFVAGEVGKRAAPRDPLRAGWPWAVWTAGGVLLAVHVAIAVLVHHGGSHASVVRSVEEQTREVYGVGVGAGVWINYLFVSVWLAEAAWWRHDPGGFLGRPVAVTALVRAFYFLILVNGTVIFAAPPRRLLGAALMAVLAWAWRDTFSGAAARRTARVRIPAGP
jgi:hypothetical protein